MCLCLPGAGRFAPWLHVLSDGFEWELGSSTGRPTSYMYHCPPAWLPASISRSQRRSCRPTSDMANGMVFGWVAAGSTLPSPVLALPSPSCIRPLSMSVGHPGLPSLVQRPEAAGANAQDPSTVQQSEQCALASLEIQSTHLYVRQLLLFVQPGTSEPQGPPWRKSRSPHHAFAPSRGACSRRC